VPVSLPHTPYAIPTYYLIATAEASSNLARYDGVRYSARAPGVKTLSEMYRRSRDEGFGAEVKRRIMLGTYALSAGYYDAYYLKAQKVRTLLTRDFEEAFRKVDAIVTPTSPTAAFRLGENRTIRWPCIWLTSTPSRRIGGAFRGFQFHAARPKRNCRLDCRFSENILTKPRFCGGARVRAVRLIRLDSDWLVVTSPAQARHEHFPFPCGLLCGS
jgi:hypothetical protein